jgi:hypothetical protein
MDALMAAVDALMNAQAALDSAEFALGQAEEALANCLQKTKACGGSCYTPASCLYCCDGICQSTPCPTPTPSTVGGGSLAPPWVPQNAILAYIAEDGGMLNVNNRAINVTFPPNAVSEPVMVVHQPQQKVPVVDFTPIRFFTLEAYTTDNCTWQKFTDFNKPVTIQVSYSPEEVAGIDEEQLGLYYFDSALNEWVALEAVADPAGDSVTVNELNYFTLHFTLYALMAPVEAAAD